MLAIFGPLFSHGSVLAITVVVWRCRGETSRVKTVGCLIDKRTKKRGNSLLKLALLVV